MQATPRLRGDLKAVPVEEAGIKYFDVSDPRSGAHMRLYDFEWLIAERMDGSTRYEDVAGWARQLGLSIGPADLADYAARLRDLGFFDASDAGEEPANEPTPVLARRNVDPDLTPLPMNTPLDPSVEINTSNGEVEVAGEDVVVDEMRPPEPPPLYEPPPAPRTNPMMAAVGTGPVTPIPQPKKSSAASMLGIVFVLLAVGGGVVYMQFFRTPPAKVTVTIASPREVDVFFDGTAELKKAEPQTLSFGENGKVVDIVAKGTEAKAGMPLGTLDGYAVLQPQLSGLKERLGFYEKQLAAAQAKGNEAAIKAAEQKVDEKKKAHDALEAKAGKLRIVAPASGTVTEVTVAAGAEAKAGAPAITIGDSRLTAELKVADGPKLGETVTLRAAGGPALSGKVTSVPEGSVVIELTSDAPTLKAGDQLRVVKKKQPNAVPVPIAALQKRDNADVVFVLSDGVAKMRKVTVVSKTAIEAHITGGLAAGESVIVGGAENLQDNQKASTN